MILILSFIKDSCNCYRRPIYGGMEHLTDPHTFKTKKNTGGDNHPEGVAESAYEKLDLSLSHRVGFGFRAFT